MSGDLVVVSLPGVQRFIAEARTTSDVANASAIYSELATEIVRVLDVAGELVLPAARSQAGKGSDPNPRVERRMLAPAK